MTTGSPVPSLRVALPGAGFAPRCACRRRLRAMLARRFACRRVAAARAVLRIVLFVFCRSRRAHRPAAALPLRTLTSAGGFVFAQSFEGGLSHRCPSPVQPANSISATSFGLAQRTLRLSLAGRIRTLERTVLRFQRAQLRAQRLLDVRAEARADAPDIGELAVAMNTPTSSERTRPLSCVQPADDHFLAAAAFRFGPGFAATGDVGRIERFRDDAFEPDLARAESSTSSPLVSKCSTY